MTDVNYKSIFSNKTAYLIFFYLAFHIITSINLEFYYDDWFFLNTFNNSSSLINNFNVLKEIYVVRPFALTYLFVLSLFSFEQITYIYIFNIFIWLLSGIILSKSLKIIIPNFPIIIFLMFFLIPSISNSFIYSPIIQGLSTISIFLWSISLLLIATSKNKIDIIFSIFFIVASILTYEISVALIPLNIFIYLNIKKQIQTKLTNIAPNLLRNFFFFFILILVIYFIQNFLGQFSEANIIKYGFFEKDFLINVKKHIFSPIKLIFINIPMLWLDGVKFFLSFNSLSFLIFLFFNILLISSIIEQKGDRPLNKNFFLSYNFFLITIFIGIFLIYLIATSVPDLKGYYNRGLLGLHILCCLFFIQLLFNKTRITFIFKILIILILNLNFNSFYIQNEIHKKNSLIRISLISETISLGPEKKLIFGYFETFNNLNDNYNFIPIFSDEVWDFSNAIRLKSLQNKFGNRIYFHSKCENILKYEHNELFGLTPSKNRRNKMLEKTKFLNKKILKDNDNLITVINFINNKSVTTNLDNLQNSLEKIFECY